MKRLRFFIEWLSYSIVMLVLAVGISVGQSHYNIPWKVIVIIGFTLLNGLLYRDIFNKLFSKMCKQIKCSENHHA